MRIREAISFRFLAHLLLLRPLLWAIFGVNIRGRENLQDLDRFILISNHNSHLDTLLIYAALPLGQILKTHPVAAGDYFSRSGRLFRVVGALFEPVWVDRLSEEGGGFARIQEALDRGDNLILFPEGTRGEPGQLQQFRSGIGRLVEANRSIPVVPFFLEGPERALPRRAPVPVPLWNHVTIAPPQRLRGESADVTRSLQKTLEGLGRESAEARQHRPQARPPAFTVAVLGIDGSGKSTLSRALARSLSRDGRACLISDRLDLFDGGKAHDLQPLLAERLRRWVSAQAKQAKSLVRYKIPKLTELFLRDHLLKEAGRWYRPASIVMDGMPLPNLTAWVVLYKEELFTEEVCSKILSILARNAPRRGEPSDSSQATDASGTARSERASVHWRTSPPRNDPIYRAFPELSHLEKLGLDRMHLPDAVIFLDVPPSVCVERIASRGERQQVHETEGKLTKLREAYLLVCAVLDREVKLPVLVLDGSQDRDRIAAEALGFLEGPRRPYET